MSPPPYTYTGGFQTFTVPATGTYDITAYGAQGGSDPSGGTGGLGAEVYGQFLLTMGDSISIAVGGQGLNGQPTYGGGGGGGSFVVDTTTGQTLLVAGGGGGGYTTNGGGGLASTGGTNLGGTGSLDAGGGGGGFAGNGGGSYATFGQGYPTLTGGVTSWTGGANGGFGGGGASGGYGAGGGGGYSGGNATYKGGGIGGGSVDHGASPVETASENSGNGEVVISTTLCFLRGTHIKTPSGEIPVEQLAVGAEVVTLGGQTRRIVWIGQGCVLATRGQRSAATPVIVRKGALADNVPHRDLRVTKSHGLYVDGALIPAEFLVNHRSIVWDDHAQEVTLYHIELETHDILLADGAPAESYRDDGNRWLFRNANSGWHLPPQEPCAPILTGGPVVDAAWKRLLDRAGPRSMPPMTGDPDLHLLVDGRRIDPQRVETQSLEPQRLDHLHLWPIPASGTAYVFRLPTRPADVRPADIRPADIRIASREVIPAELGIARDPRALGVAIGRIIIRQATRCAVIDAHDARLAQGFHAYEPNDNLRWTDGHAILPADLLAGFNGGLEIVLTLAGGTQYPDESPGERDWHPGSASAA